MILYHIHKTNKYDNDFQIGNTLEFGNKFNDFKSRSLERGCLYYDEPVKKEEEGRLILRDLEDFIRSDRIKDMSPLRKIELLTAVRGYIHNSKLDIRELIMEEVRLRQHPELPSRYSCAWLTDKESLPYWYEALNAYDLDEYTTLEVEANGNIFVSTDDLIPRSCSKQQLIYEGAERYWNPSEADLKRNTREYLLDGEMKILKRVN